MSNEAPAVLAQRHLDRAGVAYLTGINGADSDSLREAKEKLGLLSQHLTKPRNILSIGVGAGEELHALSEMFPYTARYVGIDLSSVAMGLAKDRFSHMGKDVDLSMGNAVELPFKDGSLDGIVYSSILHEVISYMPQGSWELAVREGFRVLSPKGYLLIRDPSPPKRRTPVKIHFRTAMARNFYDYFSSSFKLSNDVMGKLGVIPKRDLGGTWIERSQAGEVLMHFRNFVRDYERGLTYLGDVEWKEIEEAYFFYSNGVAHTADEYIGKVLEQGGDGAQLVQKNISLRPSTNRFLNEHFYFTDHEPNETIIEDCTQKMELLFNKKPIIDKG